MALSNVGNKADKLIEREIEMDAFDDLPKVVRQALANANLLYSAFDALMALMFGGKTIDQVIDMIEDTDRYFFEELCKEMGWEERLNELDYR